MNRILLALPLLALAACGDSRLAPPPGQHPGWPQPSPPRPSYAPLPFTTNYAPVTGQIQPSPPANPDGSIPYAVRGQPTQAPAPQPAPAQTAEPTPAPAQ